MDASENLSNPMVNAMRRVKPLKRRPTAQANIASFVDPVAGYTVDFPGQMPSTNLQQIYFLGKYLGAISSFGVPSNSKSRASFGRTPNDA
jgi:hypothetical protein